MRHSTPKHQEKHHATYPPDPYKPLDFDARRDSQAAFAPPPYNEQEEYPPYASATQNCYYPETYAPYEQDASYYSNEQPPQAQPVVDPPYPYADTAPYPDLAYQTAPISPPHPQKKRSSSDSEDNRFREGKKRSNPWLLVLIIGVLLLGGLLYFILNAYAAYQPFRSRVAATKFDVFAQGVIVDGVDIGGMTRAQAENALSQSEAHSTQALQMSVQVDGATFLMTQQDVPFERNTQAVLDKAYAIGRQNSTQTFGSSVTPLEWRYQTLKYYAANRAYLYTQITYAQSDVRKFVEAIAAKVEVAPVDAMVATFDFGSRVFTFTNEVVGADLDTDALYDAMITQLDNKHFTATIQTATTPVMPSVTRVELMNTFTKISSYTTTTTADFNRNTNVQLAANAVNGTVLGAGETFSFNETTGQRTTAKGYLEAAAIAGGTTTNEVGGGVCQVSSTLFNAAMMADLTLVYRSPHTWPSTYVDPGRDATVNWPNLDFKFKNQRETPIFIVCYYTQGKTMSSKGTLTVEIYGVTLGIGESVNLSTTLISKEEPPSDPIYQRNTALTPGTEQVLKKARTGYVYETYRVYLRNGEVYKRELLCTSTYKMIQQVIEYN